MGGLLSSPSITTCNLDIGGEFLTLKRVIISSTQKYNNIFDFVMIDSRYRQEVTAAINTRDLTKQLVRVRSSNIWSVGMNVRSRGDRTGDVLVQFKDKDGGAGDIYIYYDVPITIYRKWASAPSRGHYFWQNIRNYYKYAKLTGNKKTYLPNGM